MREAKDTSQAAGRQMRIALHTWAALALCALALGALALTPAAAQADFGFLPGEEGFKATVTAEGGEGIATLAGSHPHSLVTEVNLNKVGDFSDGDLRDLTYDLPPGLIENPTAVPRCGTAQFATPRTSPYEASLSGESCSGVSQIGIVTIDSSHAGGERRTFGVFNLPPPPGAPSRFGFSPYGEPITITPHVREAGSEYGLSLDLKNFSQLIDVSGFRLVIWGTPWDLSHNAQRANCLNEQEPGFGHAKCPVSELSPPHLTQAYLTLPSACEVPLDFHITATSWQQPAPVGRSWTSGGALTQCESLSFNPVPRGRLSTDRTSSPSGYDFTLDGSSAPLLNPLSRASSQAKKAVVVLPEGMSVNPSVASGLGVCSEAQFASETVNSPPGAGCPNASKIGELSVESPLVEGQIEGSMFFATPKQNRFGTLLALYMVAKDPDRGILVKVAGRVDSDPATGQLTTTFDDLPQLPYSHFNVHFREGQRSPLATPSACGAYATEVETSPWQNPDAVLHQSSPFALSAGVGGGPCPVGAVEPFAPQAAGGTLNANASSYTPFYLHLTRTDPEQEITSYSAVLPRGLLGKIAGVPFCPEALIEAAKRQSGAESATAPACPAASQIGRTETGYGVGQTLSYAPGTLYLAGPYHGQPLSVVAIDSAKVGPFDLGTVVIRSAIHVDRQSAQVAIDSAGSDPIPHILQGFPLRLRDIRIYIDRPHFMLNPTNCDPFAIVSTLSGAGAIFDNPADDQAATATAPFQVSNCSGLGFSPKLAFVLRGGHRRGDYPGLRATLTANEGDANIGKATVTLAPKLFIAQEHLETVCTQRQFAAHACPPGSVYGSATAITPLLDEPLSGPVYLRSNGNERPLPDLVAAISGRGIEIEVLGKIDSFKGGLRAKFDLLPDAPVSKFTMTLLGGDHALIVNATNTCEHPQVSTAKFTGQSNANRNLRVPMKVKCPKKKAGKAKKAPAKGTKAKGGGK
jgi:hypothetical protein